MSQRSGGLPNILQLVRTTSLKVLGKPGATAGAGLAGGTTSGAPVAPAGPFDKGDVIVDATGTLWICSVAGTSQSSPGAFVQVGTLVDPLTTRGDLIVRGASSSGRLALGSSGYVLTSNGTDAVWGVTPAASGGALTQISASTLSSTAASVTFSSIPGTYTSLRLLMYARTNSASTDTDNHLITFNSDTGANYMYELLNAASTSVAAAQTTSASNISIPGPAGGAATANMFNGAEMLIHAYAGTTGWKPAFTTSQHGGGSPFVAVTSGWWKSTSAITSITVTSSSGSYIAGSVFALYGMT